MAALNTYLSKNPSKNFFSPVSSSIHSVPSRSRRKSALVNGSSEPTSVKSAVKSSSERTSSMLSIVSSFGFFDAITMLGIALEKVLSFSLIISRSDFSCFSNSASSRSSTISRGNSSSMKSDIFSAKSFLAEVSILVETNSAESSQSFSLMPSLVSRTSFLVGL